MAKGQKTGGRQKGTPNKATVEIKEAARTFLADPIGQAKMLEQYQQGTLNPSVLSLMYHYAYGKPKETLALEDKSLPVLVIDRVTTRDEMLEALGTRDADAGDDEDD